MKIIAWDLAHKLLSLIYWFLVGKIKYGVLHSRWNYLIHISYFPLDPQIAKHINIKTLIKWFGCLYLQICTNGRKKNAELENRGKMRHRYDEIISFNSPFFVKRDVRSTKYDTYLKSFYRPTCLDICTTTGVWVNFWYHSTWESNYKILSILRAIFMWFINTISLLKI